MKELKEKYPDIKAIRFEGTSKNDKTGSYWSTFYIIADWTTGQPESEYYSDFTGYSSLEDIRTNGYGMSLPELMYKHDGTGKTVTSVLVTYSLGKKERGLIWLQKNSLKKRMKKYMGLPRIT